MTFQKNSLRINQTLATLMLDRWNTTTEEKAADSGIAKGKTEINKCHKV